MCLLPWILAGFHCQASRSQRENVIFTCQLMGCIPMVLEQRFLSPSIPNVLPDHHRSPP